MPSCPWTGGVAGETYWKLWKRLFPGKYQAPVGETRTRVLGIYEDVIYVGVTSDTLERTTSYRGSSVGNTFTQLCAKRLYSGKKIVQ